MMLPSPKDATHKAWLYRVLAAFCDDALLQSVFRFKGGTCAAMLGWLDRFSIDLDFDYAGNKEDISNVRERCGDIFDDLGFLVDDSSVAGLQFYLKYPAKAGERNTLKIDTNFPLPQANVYQPFRLPGIDRTLLCQSLETAFANKLCACIERYERKASIAGRDIYDVHHFFLRGFRYSGGVIEERRGGTVRDFFHELIEFIDTRVTQTTIDEDVNPLLPHDKFQKVRRHLKREVLMFLNDELARLDRS